MEKCLGTGVILQRHCVSQIPLWNQSSPPQPVRIFQEGRAQGFGGVGGACERWASGATPTPRVPHPPTHTGNTHTHTAGHTVQHEGAPRPSIRSWARGTGAAGLCRASSLWRSPGGGHRKGTGDPWGGEPEPQQRHRTKRPMIRPPLCGEVAACSVRLETVGVGWGSSSLACPDCPIGSLA